MDAYDLHMHMQQLYYEVHAVILHLTGFEKNDYMTTKNLMYVFSR